MRDRSNGMMIGYHHPSKCLQHKLRMMDGRMVGCDGKMVIIFGGYYGVGGSRIQGQVEIVFKNWRKLYSGVGGSHIGEFKEIIIFRSQRKLYRE